MHDDDDLSGVFDATEAYPTEVRDAARVIAGRYEVVDRIGSGGMGQVVRARHLRLEKVFAIKLMQAEFTQEPEAREIFIREATLASRLSHPNVVSVIDFGEDPDWGLFIVMELVEGEPLSVRIDRDGPLPVDVVCDVAEQLLAAIEHSHSHDVVHGDIKAENVTCHQELPGDKRQWTVSLVDFGMAHLASTGRREGRIAGTPAYMAPERITGGPPQPAVDIYAFGVLLYEMLTGALPFDDPDPEALLRLHLSGTPQPIAAVRGEAVDPELEALVNRSMARDPARRFATATEAMAKLRSYMHTRGLGRRHRGRRASTVGDTDRSRAALAVFEALGVPAAGLDEEGIIVIANASMARALGSSSPVELEGTNVLDTPLGKVSTFRDDLRLVAMDGKRVRRRFFATRGDQRVQMRFVLTPAGGGPVSCTLALHRLGG